MAVFVARTRRVHGRIRVMYNRVHGLYTAVNRRVHGTRWCTRAVNTVFRARARPCLQPVYRVYGIIRPTAYKRSVSGLSRLRYDEVATRRHLAAPVCRLPVSLWAHVIRRFVKPVVEPV